MQFELGFFLLFVCVSCNLHNHIEIILQLSQFVEGVPVNLRYDITVDSAIGQWLYGENTIVYGDIYVGPATEEAERFMQNICTFINTWFNYFSCKN